MTEEEIKYHNRLWYYKTYNQLIDKCLQMEKDGYPEDMYTEVHHILPRCQGGTNDKCNLVRMPARYHIVAHMLLACAFPDNSKLVIAVTAMFMYTKKRGYNISTKLVAKFREEASKKLSKINTGKHLTDEAKKKLSEKHRGKKLSEEHKRRMSESRKGMINVRKGVYQLDNSGNIVKYYLSLSEARREGNFAIRSIIKCCNNILNEYKGFKWKFEDDLFYEYIEKYLSVSFYKINNNDFIDFNFVSRNYLGIFIETSNKEIISMLSKQIKEFNSNLLVLIKLDSKKELNNISIDNIDLVLIDSSLYEVTYGNIINKVDYTRY